jgi:polar amino acid transport system permease protein
MTDTPKRKQDDMSSTETRTIDVAHARPRRRLLTWIAGPILLILALQSAQFLVTTEAFRWDIVWQYLFDGTILLGIAMTIGLTVIAMVLGTILGAVIAAARLSSHRLPRAIGGLYVWIIRSIPLLVQLLFWYNLSALMPALGVGVPFGPLLFSWSTNDVISPFTAAILALTLHEAAYMAEIIRGGLLSVERSQRDAALALGMGTFRIYVKILVPQAMRFIVPPTGSQVISMLKGTSLVSVIALADLLYTVQHIYNLNFQVIPLLIVAVLWYLAMTSLLYIGQAQIERYYGRGSVRRPAGRGRRILAENENLEETR